MLGELEEEVCEQRPPAAGHPRGHGNFSSNLTGLYIF